MNFGYLVHTAALVVSWQVVDVATDTTKGIL
jgi:hypothetical protein